MSSTMNWFGLKRARPAISLGQAIVPICASCLSLLVLNGFILDLAGIGLYPSVLVMLLVEGLLFSALVWQRRVNIPRISIDVIELVGLLLVIGVVFGYCLYLSVPDFLPISGSVDGVQHYLLIDYIYTNNALPRPVFCLDDGWITIASSYPFGLCLSIALVARLVGLPGIQVMYPFTALMVALSAGIVYNVVCYLLEDRAINKPVALLSAFVPFMSYGFFIGAFIERSFLTMLFVQLHILAFLWYLLQYAANPSSLFFITLLLASFGTVLAYPTYLPIPLLAFGFVLAVNRQRTLSWKTRQGGLFFISVLGLLAIFLRGRIETGLYLFSTEGAITTLKPSMETLPVPFILLTVAGGIRCLITYKQRRTLFLFVLAVVAEVAGTYAFPLVGFSPNRGHRLFYLVIYLMAIFSAFSLQGVAQWIARRLPVVDRRVVALFASLLLAVLVVGGVYHAHPAGKYRPITLSLYRVSQWARDHIGDRPISYIVDSESTFYWIHIAILKRTYDAWQGEAVQRWRANRPAYASWHADMAGPDWAIVEDMCDLSLDPNVSVLYRYGPSAVLKKNLP